MYEWSYCTTHTSANSRKRDVTAPIQIAIRHPALQVFELEMDSSKWTPLLVDWSSSPLILLTVYKTRGVVIEKTPLCSRRKPVVCPKRLVTNEMYPEDYGINSAVSLSQVISLDIPISEASPGDMGRWDWKREKE